jgi:hypothetical protein
VPYIPIAQSFTFHSRVHFRHLTTAEFNVAVEPIIRITNANKFSSVTFPIEYLFISAMLDVKQLQSQLVVIFAQFSSLLEQFFAFLDLYFC